MKISFQTLTLNQEEFGGLHMHLMPRKVETFFGWERLTAAYGKEL